MKSFHLTFTEEEYEQLMTLKGGLSMKQFLVNKALETASDSSRKQLINTQQIHEDLTDILIDLNHLRASVTTLSYELLQEGLEEKKVDKLTENVVGFKQKILKKLSKIQSEIS